MGNFNAQNFFLNQGNTGSRPGGSVPLEFLQPAKPDSKKIAKILTVAERKVREKEFSDAVELLDRVEKVDPNNIKMLSILANLHLNQERFDLATVPLMKILSIDPENSMAYTNLGTIMSHWKARDGAIALYEKALACDPNNPAAAVRLVHNSLYLCEWKNWGNLKFFKELFYKKLNTMDPGVYLTMVDDPALQRKKSENYFEGFIGHQTQNRPQPRLRAEGDKIRLGYFSADFHKHATMWLMARMLELHDKDKFEVFLYNYGSKTDEMTERVTHAADHVRQVKNMSDAEIVALAQSDGIDIAIDLKGYTIEGRASIVYKNPAPINVSYLGYPGTIGSKDLDYIVADPVVIPPALRKHYSEKIIYMPDCYQVADNTRAVADHTPTRAELGLPEDKFVLCSFNSHYKITPQEFDVWMRVLNKVEDAILWIWCREETARANLVKEAEARGVTRDRIYFAESLPQEQHLARMRAADLFMDTFAVCAHTTASDAMWAGLPVVTLEGQQFAARVASSILQAMEVPELVTRSPEEYEALILDLAENRDKLAQIRAKIAEKRLTAPMFDTERFTRNWEKQLERALVRCESGLKPDHLMP